MGRNKGGFNRTLTELWLGIIAVDALIMLVGIWFVPQKSECAIGLVIGMIIAMLMSYHMSWAFDRFLSLPRKRAGALITVHAIIRYLATALLLYLVMISGFANPIAAFVGIMGLKFGAYIQPAIHKITVIKYPDPEPPPGIPDEEEVVE